MSDSSDAQVLAIDGGGTRCRFALVRGKERQIVEGGPANAFSDMDGTLACIRDGLRALGQRSNLSEEDLIRLPTFVGLAGVIGPTIAKRLGAALPFTNAAYADDRHSALRGALGANDGYVAHCGTGSFLAAQISSHTRLAGGWGVALGDEASAQWVGRHALKHALLSYDGFGTPSAITDALLADFGGPDGILHFVTSATAEGYGAIAPRVTDWADAGDDTAVQILAAGANYLADGLGRMGWRPGRTICLTGGIGPHYAAHLPAHMQKDLKAPIGSPLDGAIELAQARANEVHHGHR